MNSDPVASNTDLQARRIVTADQLKDLGICQECIATLKVIHNHVWSLNSDNNASQNEYKQG